ncbi:hypothetical protein QGP82_10125 [Leptothoe sp. LEGE 181152]|nr:hypothetical protein [Leptothoe sp. LEGE 181152]
MKSTDKANKSTKGNSDTTANVQGNRNRRRAIRLGQGAIRLLGQGRSRSGQGGIQFESRPRLSPTTLKKIHHREFFEAAEWWKYLTDIDISKEGQKGGVIYINTNLKRKRQYVVKVTDAPQQILFAEGVLKDLGKARTPKSLIIPLNLSKKKGSYFPNLKTSSPDILNSHKLIEHIKTRGTDISKQKNDKKSKKYNEFLTSLDSSKYLIVMKNLKYHSSGNSWGQSRGFENVIFDLIGWAKDNGLTRRDSITINNDTIKEKLKSDKKLRSIVNKFYSNKEILANRDFMINIGRVMAADCLLGNGDRFGETLNLGNAIYTDKTYSKDNKVNYPISVIDNDSFLPVFNPESLNKAISVITSKGKGDNPIEKYIDFTTRTGKELTNSADPIYFPDLSEILGNFDHGWFFKKFICSIFIEDIPPLVREIFEDDGKIYDSIFKLSIAKKYSQFKVISTRSNKIDLKDFPNWTIIRNQILEGFLEVIKEIQEDKRLLYHFYECHADLINRFKVTTINFDWIAFWVRYQYMSSIRVTSKTTFKFDGHSAVLSLIQKKILEGEHNLQLDLDSYQIIDAALINCVKKTFITSDERASFLDFFKKSIINSRKFIPLKEDEFSGLQGALDEKKEISNIIMLALIKIFFNNYSQKSKLDDAPGFMGLNDVINFNLIEVDAFRQKLLFVNFIDVLCDSIKQKRESASDDEKKIMLKEMPNMKFAVQILEEMGKKSGLDLIVLLQNVGLHYLK